MEHIKLDKAKRNWPDRLFFGRGGRYFIVEFKRPGEKPRPAQKALHKRLKERGHPVHVIDEYAAFISLLFSDGFEPEDSTLPRRC